MRRHLRDYFAGWSHLDKSPAGSDLGTENRVSVVQEALEKASATLVCKTSKPLYAQVKCRSVSNACVITHRITLLQITSIFMTG